MSLGKKFFHQNPADSSGSGAASAQEGLILHLDANDEDSIESGGANVGNGSGTWFDISSHDLTIPRIDKGSNLKFHINASDSTSYVGGGSRWNDISGNNINGTITDPEFVSDLAGSLKFDYASNGDGDKVVFAHDPVFNKSTNVSFEVWVKRDTTSEMNILHKGSSISDSHFLTWNNNGYYFYSFTTGGGVYSNTTGYNTGVFEHVVCTIDGSGNKKMYVNGEISQYHATNGSVGTTNLSNTDNLVIGGYYDPASHRGFDGQISVVRIYDVTLTASEVGQNYRAGHNFSYSSIITSKDSATQGTLITVPPTQGTIHSTNQQLNLDANSYSSGTWSDSSGNSRNATVYSATYVNNDNSDYFELDGSNSYFTVPSNSVFDWSSSFSLEMWVKINNNSSEQYIIGKSDNSGGSYGWYLGVFNSSGNTLEFGAYNDGDTRFQNTPSTTDVFKKWIHIVITIDSSNINFYIDGINREQVAYSGTPSTTSSVLDIGHSPFNNTAKLNGEIAQVRFYNAALTTTEVNTNYNATKDLYQGATNIELHLDANGYSSGAWSDSSGNSRNGTITDAVHTNDNNSDYFTFDGATNSSGDKVVVTHTTDLEANQDFSIEMWVWRNDDTDHSLINKGPNNATSWDISFGASSDFGYQFNNYSGEARVRTGTGDFTSANRWEHIVVTYDDETKKPDFYIDGVLRVSHTHQAGTGTPSGSTSDLNIGGYYQYVGRHGWNGRIAQVRFYKGKLTQDQVITNYNATKSLYQNPTALIDYRPSNYSGSGTSITNLGSLSNDAVLTGGIESTYDKELGDFFTIDGGSNTGDGIETTSNVSGVNLNTDGFSWEIWVNITSDSYSYITSFNYSSTYYNFSYRSDSDKVTFFNLGTALNTPALELNRWYHIIGTANSAGTKLYTDGILSDSNTTAAPNHNLDSKIYFGTYWGHNSAQHIHTGPIGDGRFYKGVLTAEQVIQNYLASKKYYPNGNHFTNNGATFTYASSPYYFNFDGDNDYMSLAQNTQFDFDVPTTMEIWLYKANTSREWVIDKANGGSGNYGWQLLLNNAGDFRFQVHNTSNGTAEADTTSTIYANTYYHLCVTHDGSNVFKIYLNGSLEGTGTLSGTLSTNTNGITLGKYSLASGYEFEGRISMVKFFQKTFSATEVTAAYDATKSTFGY